MSDIDVDQWLEQWVEEHLRAAGHADTKADMRDVAKTCAAAATAAGITMIELKSAANGDLETYLVERQIARETRTAAGNGAT